MLNFGVWGPGPTNRSKFINWNRAFERKVKELGGQKWLYAHTYYTEKEFDEIYDKKSYEALRTKYFVSSPFLVFLRILKEQSVIILFTYNIGVTPA